MSLNTTPTRNVRATVVDVLPHFGLADCSDGRHSWAITKSTQSRSSGAFEALQPGQPVTLELLRVDDAEVVSAFSPLAD